MSQKMEDLPTALVINQVPGRNPFHLTSWEKDAWPSRKNLAQLVQRHAQARHAAALVGGARSAHLALAARALQPHGVPHGRDPGRRAHLPLDKMTTETHVTTYSREQDGHLAGQVTRPTARSCTASSSRARAGRRSRSGGEGQQGAFVLAEGSTPTRSSRACAKSGTMLGVQPMIDKLSSMPRDARTRPELLRTTAGPRLVAERADVARRRDRAGRRARVDVARGGRAARAPVGSDGGA